MSHDPVTVSEGKVYAKWYHVYHFTKFDRNWFISVQTQILEYYSCKNKQDSHNLEQTSMAEYQI